MVAEKRARAAANQREERANSWRCDTVAESVTCCAILGDSEMDEQEAPESCLATRAAIKNDTARVAVLPVAGI